MCEQLEHDNIPFYHTFPFSLLVKKMVFLHFLHPAPGKLTHPHHLTLIPHFLPSIHLSITYNQLSPPPCQVFLLSPVFCLTSAHPQSSMCSPFWSLCKSGSAWTSHSISSSPHQDQTPPPHQTCPWPVSRKLYFSIVISSII